MKKHEFLKQLLLVRNHCSRHKTERGRDFHIEILIISKNMKFEVNVLPWIKKHAIFLLEVATVTNISIANSASYFNFISGQLWKITTCKNKSIRKNVLTITKISSLIFILFILLLPYCEVMTYLETRSRKMVEKLYIDNISIN